MIAILLACIFVACPFILVSAEKKYHNQSEIIDDMLDNMFSCMQELDLKPDICGEMLLKNKDLTDKKYDSCKCLSPCVAKKMGTMDPVTGKWNWAKFKEYSDLMENEVLKSEAQTMQKHCYDEINTHCEAGFAVMKCALEKSPMIKDMAKSYVATLENQEQSDQE